MCTVVVLIRPGHDAPVMLAANRDENLARAWDSPGPWWPDHPGTVGGRDREGGGTWLGVNRDGVIAAVLNRPGSLGPAPGKRSRGELPLLALAHATAGAAADAIAALDAGAWRAFNMVIADRCGAMFVRGLGQGRPQVLALPPGVSMVTAHDPNDLDSPRVARHLPRFRAAPSPDTDEWRAWRALLADRAGGPGAEINVTARGGFGTGSSALIALPRDGAPSWLFAPGPPDATEYGPVVLVA